MVMAQLLARAPAAARRGHAVVVACVCGEQHELGARMVGDFFEMAGWDTYFCGANTPHAGVVQSAVERAASVVAVSATMGCHVHEVQELIEAVRAEPRCAGSHVMVGGRPFAVDPALWRTVGAAGTAADADAAVALAGQWLAESAAPPSPQPQ
jgi:methylmalonyl-CoA mutase cobalamin-binding domain/chain